MTCGVAPHDISQLPTTSVVAAGESGTGQVNFRVVPAQNTVIVPDVAPGLYTVWVETGGVTHKREQVKVVCPLTAVIISWRP